MRIAVFPEDDGGTGRYRMRYPAAFAAADGHDVVILDKLAPTWQGEGANKRCHHVPVDTDVLVIQRPLHADYTALILQAQTQGIAVVVDVDDDFEHLPTGHGMHGAWRGDYRPAHLNAACAIADLVTVSTPELARIYAPHGRFMVLRNCVPSSFLSVTPERSDERINVGWTGLIDTHIGDLATLGNAVPRALRADERARFCVLGESVSKLTPPQPSAVVQLGLDARRLATLGPVNIDNYPDAYAMLDVAVAPVVANTFARSKSFLKPLEAAALGVACVATDYGEYRLAGDLGLCDVAMTPKQWERKLRRLIADPDHRAERAHNQRTAARAHTYEANAWRWVEAWDQAAEFATARRQRKATAA